MNCTFSTSLARAGVVAALVAGALTVPLAGSAAAAPAAGAPVAGFAAAATSCRDEGPISIGPAPAVPTFRRMTVLGTNIRVRAAADSRACAEALIRRGERVFAACAKSGGVPRGFASDQWFYVKHRTRTGAVTYGWTYGRYLRSATGFGVPDCPAGL